MLRSIIERLALIGVRTVGQSFEIERAQLNEERALPSKILISNYFQSDGRWPGLAGTRKVAACSSGDRIQDTRQRTAISFLPGGSPSGPGLGVVEVSSQTFSIDPPGPISSPASFVPPCRAVSCRAVPCRTVPRRAVDRDGHMQKSS